MFHGWVRRIAVDHKERKGGVEIEYESDCTSDEVGIKSKINLTLSLPDDGISPAKVVVHVSDSHGPLVHDIALEGKPEEIWNHAVKMVKQKIPLLLKGVDSINKANAATMMIPKIENAWRLPAGIIVDDGARASLSTTDEEDKPSSTKEALLRHVASMKDKDKTIRKPDGKEGEGNKEELQKKGDHEKPSGKPFS